MATKFQSDMTMIHTQAGASTQEVQDMGQALIDLAPSVGMGPDALAAGLFHLESAGFRGQTALNALKIAAEGAQVGHANLEDVTNSLDAVLVAGGKDATDMGGSMGELNAIVGAGDMHMQDLADAMGTGVLASAHSFGLSLKDVGGALATFGDNNIRGSKAAVYLRQAISMMGAPSLAAAKALKSVGLGSTTLADDMRTGGLTKALADLKKHLADSGLTASNQAQVLAHAFGGGKTSSGILILLSQLSRVQSKTKEIGDTGKNFGSDWNSTTQTVAQQQADLKASIDAVGVSLGTAFLPMISQALHMVMPFITGIATWISNNRQLAATFLIVAGGIFAVMVPLGLLVAAVAAIGGTTLLAVAAVVGIILILTHWTQTVAIVQSVIAKLGPFVSSVFAALLAFLGQIVPKLVKAAQDLATKVLAAIVKELGQLPTQAGIVFAKFLEFLVTVPSLLFSAALAIGTAIVDGIVTFGPTILSDAISFFGQLASFLVSLPTKMAGLALDIAAGFVKGFIQGLGSLPSQVAKVFHGVPLLGNVMDMGGSALGAITSHMPHLAAGGLVNQPTLALIGENGPEAVVPLGGGTGITTDLASLGMDLGVSDTTIHTHIYLDGRVLADVVDKHLGRQRALRGSSLSLA